MSAARGRVVLLALAVGMLVIAARARAYEPVTWRTLDGGGVSFANAGSYRLGATIGQADAGTLTGGAFALRGGFWLGGGVVVTGVGGGAPPSGALRFDAARPNPIRSSARLAFELPRASRVGLSVFDLSGRAVRRCDYGPLAAGRQERTWDAVDRNGRALPSGVYFLRLEMDNEARVRRVLLVR